MMERRIAIVGNGPLPPGLAGEIDASDLVIRFNEPPHTPEQAGARTDILFLMNSGKTMQRRLRDPAYAASPMFRNARKIILPYHPSILARYHPQPNFLSRLKGRKTDWTAETQEMCAKAGKEVVILSPEFYEASCKELGIDAARKRELFPSSGFLAIRYALTEVAEPNRSVHIHGFGWTGWKRHDWKAERAWVTQSMARTHAIRLTYSSQT